MHEQPNPSKILQTGLAFCLEDAVERYRDGPLHGIGAWAPWPAPALGA